VSDGPARIGVVGAGLIGTSITWAARRAGRDVVVVDRDPARARTAAAISGARQGMFADLAGCDHVVVATPTPVIAPVVAELLDLTPDLTVSDVGSVKADVLLEIESLRPHPSRFCGAHPIAGSERSGPTAARPDLFHHAPWVLCPGPSTAAATLAAAEDVARLCGARVTRLSPDEHDRVLATVSHLPQLVASALAGLLLELEPRRVALAGTGLRDTVRLAGSDPELWTGIAVANRVWLAAALDRLAERVRATASAVAAADAAGIAAVLEAGRAGWALLPGKPGGRTPDWEPVPVVLADRPGELARLLAAVGSAGINVEDLRIDHAPDQPAGVVELVVERSALPRLHEVLAAGGWADLE
jgi:prephenate dehydrogenase